MAQHIFISPHVALRAKTLDTPNIGCMLACLTWRLALPVIPASGTQPALNNGEEMDRNRMKKWVGLRNQ